MKSNHTNGVGSRTLILLMTLLLAISESEAEAELKKQITTLDLGPSDLVLPTESQEMENV